ncbi:MAG: hypothetical protein J6C55_00055 [Oscillospiraceae bacterium]|nr:hypothetical protein [Oscillospiraceae bacterium]
MSTTEQKLRKIEEIILEKANSKADDLIFKAMTQKNELLEEKEIEVLQKKYKEINKETTEIRRKTTQYISDFEIKNKRQLLLKRDEFCNQIFENVFVKLCNFTKTDDYSKMFEKKLSELRLENISDIVFYIKSDDQILCDLIKKKFGESLKIKQDVDIKIGGLKIVNKNTGLCLDETLDTKLMDQRSWFYSNAQLLAY